MNNGELQINQTKPEKPSLWAILWKPVETFERIRENPRIFGALVMVTLLFVIGAALNALSVTPEQIANELGQEFLSELQGDLTGDELMTGSILSGIIVVTAVFSTLFTPVLSILISSAILLLIAKIVRSEVSFKQLFSMNTYMFLLTGLSALINGLAAFLLKSPNVFVTNLGSIIPSEGALNGLLTNLDLFNIWGVILTALGLNIVASFSKKLSWSISIIFFIIGVIFSMIGAAIDAAIL